MTLPGQNARWPQNNRRIAVYHLPDKNGHTLFMADFPFDYAGIIADDGAILGRFPQTNSHWKNYGDFSWLLGREDKDQRMKTVILPPHGTIRN